MSHREQPGAPAERPGEQETAFAQSSELESTLLPGLVIVSAIIAVGFGYASRMTGGEQAALWNKGLVFSSMAFLGLFVRLLLAHASRSLNGPHGSEHRAPSGDTNRWTTRER